MAEKEEEAGNHRPDPKHQFSEPQMRETPVARGFWKRGLSTLVARFPPEAHRAKEGGSFLFHAWNPLDRGGQ